MRVRGDPSHPVTKGFTCPKALRFPQYYESRRRVLYPYIKIESKFERVSWNDALDLIANKIKETIREFGPEKILVFNYTGNMGLINFNYPLRLFYAIKATRVRYTVCDEAGELALELHYGMRYGAFPEDMEKARLLVIWGANIASSSVHAYRIAADLKAKGATIWIIDPRRTKTSLLGRHIRPKPGTDAVLAAGISWYIINEFGVDEEFIRRYTKGYEEYRRLISKYDPETVQRITGIAKEDLRDIARDYASLKPSVTYIGTGMQKTIYGAEAVRVISLISALVGVHRGFFFSNSSRDFDVAYLQGRSLGPDRRVNMIDVPRLLAEGEFKLLYVYGSNPALSLPRADLFRKGMMREDLFSIVHEVVWSETAELSDVVLPATSMMEHEDLVASWWHPYLGYSPQITEPLGESRPNWWVVKELASRLGLKLPELREDPMEAINKVLRRSRMVNITLEELKSKGYAKLSYPLKDEYQTPSGKIEFLSSNARKLGYSPLPNIGWDEGIEGYPYRFLTSSIPEMTSTQDLMPTDMFRRDNVHVSREDAASLGIEDGCLLLIRSSEGSEAIAVAEIDDSLPSGVLWARRSAKFIKGSVNDLLTDKKQDIVGGSVFNSSYVAIEPITLD